MNCSHKANLSLFDFKGSVGSSFGFVILFSSATLGLMKLYLKLALMTVLKDKIMDFWQFHF